MWRRAPLALLLGAAFVAGCASAAQESGLVQVSAHRIGCFPEMTTISGVEPSAARPEKWVATCAGGQSFACTRAGCRPFRTQCDGYPEN